MMIEHDNPLERDPQGLHEADASRRMWDSALPTIWYTPEDIDKPRVLPLKLSVSRPHG